MWQMSVPLLWMIDCCIPCINLSDGTYRRLREKSTVDCCILIQSPRTDAADLPPDPAGIPQLPRGIDAIVVAPADTAGAPPPPLAYAATTNRRQCGCESPLGPSLPGGENQPVTPSVHLCTASTALAMAMAAKSTPPTPPPVTMVLSGFGRDGTAIWRLPP